MLWLHFGAKRIIPSASRRRPEPREVGDFALHLQCPWRFRVGSRVLVGSDDIAMPRLSATAAREEAEVESAPGNTRLDQQLEFLHRRFLPTMVRKLSWQSAKAFTLEFQSELSLDVFPNSPWGEQWRFFVPGDQSREHLVVEFQPIESSPSLDSGACLSDPSSIRRAAHASVRFMSETLDPLLVTQLIRLPCTHSHRNGEPRIRRAWSGKVHEYSAYLQGMWSMSSKDWVASDDLDTHIQWLLEQLEPRRAELTQLLVSGVEGDIFCYSLGPGEATPTLREDTVDRVKALALSIDIDHYDNADTDDEAG
jgi:hypothetical protein